MTCKPDNFPWLSPYLIMHDVDEMIAFYEKAFGFKFRSGHKGDTDKYQHAEMDYQNQVIMMGQEGSYGDKGDYWSPKTSGHPPAISLYVYVENVDTFYEKAVQAGAVSKLAPEDTFWGDRMCNVEDPAGFSWSFATRTGE